MCFNVYAFRLIKNEIINNSRDYANSSKFLQPVYRRNWSEGCIGFVHSYLSGQTLTFASGDDRNGPFNVNCSVPQGSVLGPIKFTYTDDVAELFDRHGLNHHLFADDKQVYTSTALVESNGCRQHLSACIHDELQEWCASRRLQLNASKTELIWFSS